MSDVKVGDRVRIVAEYRDIPSDLDGKEGVLAKIDQYDTVYPHFVRVDGSEFATWVHRAEAASPRAGTDREALVTRAKELLTGTPHTVADIIAMAAFLAGE
ncbi:hypothetical protein OG554_03435 [Streptomyces griseus]|uniref:hypothetical protein n=1 Tax=Streptomyces griseus TaxID=1911 RepID=UPI00386534F1|nr:hypothetical protein OG554_03435 [Streptomyces fimicarius]